MPTRARSRATPAILVAALLLPGFARAAQSADADLAVYLQPLAPEAARLTFTVASIAALASDGTEQPLDVNLRVVDRASAGRQRLFASSRLPLGSYTGLAIVLKSASLKREGSDAALLVPETPVRVAAPFALRHERAVVLWITLDYDASIAAAQFRPAFAATAPPRPLADHAGFVTNTRSNTITVFDKSLGQAVGLIDTCAGPAGIALDRHRRRLYVACTFDDEVRAIDIATGELVERARLSPGDRPGDVALTPDGLTLVAVGTRSNSVSFFDALSLARQERVSVGTGPGAVVIDRTGQRAFVCNRLDRSVSVIDIANRRLLASLSTEAAPLRAQFSSQGDRLYVVHERSPYMTVLDARQLTTLSRVRLRSGVDALAVDTVSNLICVGGERDSTIEFYDPNALLPLNSVRTPAGVSYAFFDVESHALYLVHGRARSISVARLDDRKVVHEIDVGVEPYAVIVMGGR